MPKYCHFSARSLEAYNDPLQILAELGLIGDIIFVLIVWNVIRAMIKAKNHVSCILYPCGASFLAFVVLSMFDYPMEILPTFTLSFFFLARSSDNFVSSHQLRLRLSPLYQKPLVLALLTLAVLLAIHSKALLNGYGKWEEAYESTQVGNYPEAETQYRKLLPIFGQNGEFLFMYGATLTLSKKYARAVPVLENAKQSYNDPKLWISLADANEGVGKYEQAESELKKASDIEPHEFYPRYLLMKLFTKERKLDDALAVAKEIVVMPVKIPSPAVQEVKGKADSLIQSRAPFKPN